MRRGFILFFCLILLSKISIAQFEPPAAVEATTFGRLTVYSDITGVDIYVDGKYVGQDRATISNIPSGKHYVRVLKAEETIQSGIVTVKEGEETIIVAKPSADKLLERMKRPTYVFFYGGYTDLDYNSTVGPGQPAPAGTYSFEYKQQLGFGAEVQMPIPQTNFNLNFGFFQNYPGKITLSPSAEGELAISTPYLNISTNILKTQFFKVNVGGGINYAIYSPGFGTFISIEGRLGYQLFVEALRAMADNSTLVLRLAYASYNGRGLGTSATGSTFPLDINAPGYHLQAGVAYQL